MLENSPSSLSLTLLLYISISLYILYLYDSDTEWLLSSSIVWNFRLIFVMSLSNTSDRRWPSNKSLASFYSPSLPNMPGYYNRSMIAPLSLSQRKAPSHSTGSHLPALKMRSTLTFCSSEDDDKTLTRPSIIVEEEDNLMMRKLDRVRVNYAVSILRLHRKVHHWSMLTVYVYISTRSTSPRYVHVDCLGCSAILILKP